MFLEFCRMEKQNFLKTHFQFSIIYPNCIIIFGS